MREKLKKLSPLWTALAAVALAGAIAFAVLVGAGVSAAGARDPFPVPAASGAVRMAEDDAYFVAADAEGELSCYNKTDGTLLFSYRKPTAEDSGGGADVLNVSLYDGQVFALYSDRQVLRFAADGDGVPAGALETNYVPQKAYFPASGNLFAVYGIVGSRKEVYLLRTDFGGTPAAPVSYREYPKLDGGEYAVSSGGVETGVQGICVAEDGYVYVASDIYTVRRFTANGMEDGYEQYDVPAQKLAAFCETETGFAGMDLAGNFYRFDDTFQTEYTLRTGQAFDTVLCADGTFYGVGGGRVVGVRSDEGVLFNIAAEGDSLVLARGNAFVLSGGGDAPRYIGVALARRLASFAGLLSLYIPLLAVFALFSVFAGLHAWRPLGARVNRGLAVCGKTFVKHKLAYIGLIPTFALLAVFYYWPIVRGFGLSFFNYNGVTSQFVGLQNFVDVLKNTIFWNSTLNMFILLVTDLVKAIVPPLIFAEFILAVRSKRFSFIVRVLLFIPGILPGVAGTLVWVNGIFGSDSYGLLNSICSLFVPGFMQTWIGPYLETRSLVSIIMFSFPWVGSYLIFYGGVMGIPKSLFEAAELDGCGWWRRMATIDLPLIFAQIKYIFITSFIASVQDYGRLFITDQSTGHGLKVPALIIYESIYKGGSEPNYGLSSAMSMFLFVFLLAATILSFRKQTSKEEL